MATKLTDLDQSKILYALCNQNGSLVLDNDGALLLFSEWDRAKRFAVHYPSLVASGADPIMLFIGQFFQILGCRVGHYVLDREPVPKSDFSP